MTLVELKIFIQLKRHAYQFSKSSVGTDYQNHEMKCRYQCNNNESSVPLRCCGTVTLEEEQIISELEDEEDSRDTV